MIGRGPHGEYLTGATGDWNDFSTEFNQMTESDLVTAQAAYIYPRLALVADHLGDTPSRRSCARPAPAISPRSRVSTCPAAGSRAATRGSGSSGPARSSPSRSRGRCSRARRPRPRRRRWSRTTAATWSGSGRPSGPTKIGAALAPGSSDPGAKEQTEPPVNGSTEWPGGAWFAVNGWWTWALEELGGALPNAVGYAFDEFRRNTLAAHATAFPDHWDGVISVDDECAAYFQSPNSGCGIGLATGEGAIPGYDTQVMHQPAYSLFDLVKLAGVDPTSGGYQIVPRLPLSTFDVRLPEVGVAQQPGTIRGYFRTAGGSVTMDVAPPPGVSATSAVAWANGRQVPSTVVGGLVQFTLGAAAGRPADWAVT